MKPCIKNLFLLPALIAGLGLLLAGRATAQTFTTLHNFSGGSDGSDPQAGLIVSGSTLFGVADSGGTNGSGTVFDLSTSGGSFTNLYNFSPTSGSPNYGTNSDGAYSDGTLLLSGNTLYGTVYYGGTNGVGTVFALNTNGMFTTLHSFSAGKTNSTTSLFTNSDGFGPEVGLILSGSTLYGTTENGGTGGYGVVFKVNTDGTGFLNLHNFTNGTDGSTPHTLVLSGSTLYGTSMGSATNGNGAVFALNTNGTGFTTLHSFTTTNISVIMGGPVSGPSFTNSDGFAPSGLALWGSTLYGTAGWGGTNGNGTVFALNTNGTGFTILHSFAASSTNSIGVYTNSEGVHPMEFTGLILSSNTLYGTANWGGNAGNGTVFALNTNGSGFMTLHSFTATDGSGNNSDGANPYAGLTLSGNSLYGTARYGGTNGDGAVFNIYLGLIVTTTSLPQGTNGVAYNQALAASGGQAPYLWTNSSGTLPTGLTLATNGVISGTPTTNGTYNFTVKVTDASSSTATQALTLNISPPLEVTTVSLPSGTNGFGYSQQLSAVNGQPPYSWSLLSDSLPAGLTLTTGGLISGTPTTNGTFNFTVKVTDASSSTATQALTLNISPPLEVTTVSLPSGTNGFGYSQQLSAVNGQPPYSWSLLSGSLPAGLTLTTGGLISGTPTTNGTFNFTVKVIDASSSTATQALSLTINSQFLYTTSVGMITITGYMGPGGAVVIPGQIGGLPVTSIGGNAFASWANLTSVTIGTNITSISSNAFFDCHSLTNATLGNRVASIGAGAFSGTGLTSIMIPSSVTDIGEGAFEDCTNLTAITVDSGNLFYSSLDGVLFDKGQTVLIQFPAGWYGNYTVPDSVINIGDGAFSFCHLVDDLYFSGDAPTLGTNVFFADNLTNYYLPCANGWNSMFGGMPAVARDWMTTWPDFGRVYGMDNAFYVKFPSVDCCGHALTWLYGYSFVGSTFHMINANNQGFSFIASGGYIFVSFMATNDVGERVYVDSSPMAFSVPVATNLVLNGDFETGDFTNWTLSGDTTWIFVDDGSGIPPLSGKYEAALETWDAPGYLSQTLSTTPGASYLLSFWLNNTNGDPGEFMVSWNGKTLMDEVNPVTIGNWWDNGWTNLQFVVSATGANTLLQFGFRDDSWSGNNWFGLDDIHVVACSTTPPPAILSAPQITVGKTNFTFLVSGPAGSNYVLQVSTNLLNWSSVSTSAIPVSGSVNLTNAITNYNRSFYRVHLQ